jgi:hypothetical protein
MPRLDRTNAMAQSDMGNNKLSIQNKVFFVTYGGGHAAALAPVMSALLRKTMDLRILALTTAMSYLTLRSIEAWSMADVCSVVKGYRGVRRVGRLLAKEQIHHSSISRADSEAYLGVGFHALVRSHGLRQAKVIYGQGGRQHFRPVDFFRSWFEQQRPAVVVATSAPRSERAALEAARDLGIPSVCVVDLFAPFEIEWCASPDYASKICVLDGTVAQRFLSQGVPADRVVVTGNPAFDRLARLDVNQLRSDTRRAMGIKDGEWVVSWMSQPEPAHHPFSEAAGDPTLPEQIERYLVAGLRDRPEVNLVLRHHPSEDRRKELDGGRVRYSDVTHPLDELLCASDCVLTCSSTVGLEAALLGIPVVQCMDSIFSHDLPLAELGYAKSVERYAQLWPVIDAVLRLPPRQIEHCLPSSDASSAGDRVADNIFQLFNP